MNSARTVLFQSLEGASLSPVYRELHTLAEAEATSIGFAPELHSAADVYALWSIRLWNSMLQHKRILGLLDLVTALRALPSSSMLKQISVIAERRNAVLFIDDREQAVGAAISRSHQPVADPVRVHFDQPSFFELAGVGHKSSRQTQLAKDGTPLP